MGHVKSTSLMTITHNIIIVQGKSNSQNMMTWEFIIEKGKEIEIVVEYESINKIKKNKKGEIV